MTDEILIDFIAESKDHLGDIESDLLAMENTDPIDDDVVNKVFRAAHSIKGGAGFLGLTKIQEVAHKTENILVMIRSGEMLPSSEVINLLLTSFDKLSEMLDDESLGADAELDDLLQGLVSLTHQFLEGEEKETVTRKFTNPHLENIDFHNVTEFDVSRSIEEGNTIYLLNFNMIHDFDTEDRSPLVLMEQLSLLGTVLDCVIDIFKVGNLDGEFENTLPLSVLYATQFGKADLLPLVNIAEENIIKIDISEGQSEVPQRPKAIEEVPTEVPAVEPQVEKESNNKSAPQKAPTTSKQGVNKQDESLRVSLDVLEKLMNSAGELVLARNQLVNSLTSMDEKDIKNSKQRITLVTEELQETIMKTRMQPVGNLFGRFKRVVRDLSKQCDKEIELSLSGNDVEMDKTILENITDPLSHMLRNSIDHGIESPEERVAKGKPRGGTISLDAYYDAGQVYIEIKDDGKGIDVERVCSKALENGVVSEAQLESMGMSDKLSLIFMPGFSTAEVVTDLSGRGVGMDVVKSNIEKINGSVEISSKKDVGSKFIVKLPMTLAIIPSLLVKFNQNRLAIPQVNVKELITISADSLTKRIGPLGGGEVFTLRGEIIPIVKATKYFDIEVGEEQEGKDVNIVIVSSDKGEFGIVVDDYDETLEIVVRPLGHHFKHQKEYMGATILGDGNVALILDVNAIAQKTGVSKLREEHQKNLNGESGPTVESAETGHFLLFNGGANELCGVPLSLVSRIENIDPEKITHVGGKRTIPYGETSLPLFELNDVAQTSNFEKNQELVAIIFHLYKSDIGIVAAKPLDIVELPFDFDKSVLKQDGIMGSCIINEKTNLIVDVFELVEKADPEFFSNEVNVSDSDKKKQIVLAEDTVFFREQISKFLTDANFEVAAFENGKEAYEYLEENTNKVSLLVTDIEMPVMSGLELTSEIRNNDKLKSLPIIAVTSLASNQDVENGINAGVDEYHTKLDKEKLLSAIIKMTEK